LKQGSTPESSAFDVCDAPEMVGAVERLTEVFVGGRVRSGLDLLKFLRLSAKACFIDRA
jgi:isopentenyl diphosphate isomerase/L-lactate dehydrogenase-like FMN-dependent dehydrogenase